MLRSVLAFISLDFSVLNSMQLVGSEMDIGEVVGLAVATNDVAGLIADVLVRLRPAE